MQPLSTFRKFRGARLALMQDNIMSLAPEIAKLVAEAVAQWSEVECLQGTLLAYIIDAEPQTAGAMYLALNAANAREALLNSAAQTKMSVREYDVFCAVMAYVRSTAKQRNRLAHWCWATSLDIPKDTLLLIDPASRISYEANFQAGPQNYKPHDDREIFVVSRDDISRIVRDIVCARSYLGRMAGMMWKANTQEKRDELRRSLSAEPAIRQFLQNA